MKRCPYCAEEIQDQATRCRFCREDLRGAGAGGRAGRSQKSGWSTVLVVILVLGVVGVVFVGIVAAIAVPSLLRARLAANEVSAVGTMRSLVTAQSTWRQNDTDRNTVNDYWTADVSGFYRIESEPAGSGIGVAVLDVAVAQADDDKFAQGAAVAGEQVPGTRTTAASLISLTRTAAKSGYYYRAIVKDATGTRYASDPDGNRQAWTNTRSFGFQARPEVYNSTGIYTMIVSENGCIYRQDCGSSAPNNADAWPAANPASAGWRIFQ